MRLRRALQLLEHARRIGIVRTDHLGDMVLTLPLARALRQAVPTATVALIAHSRTAPLIEGLPILDRCYYVDRMPLRDILRVECFDVLFFPRAKASEAWDALRCRVPLRVGTAYRWWSWMYNVRIHDHRSQGLYHEVEYNLRMLSAITGQQYGTELVRIPVADRARSELAALLARFGIGGDEPLIVLHPGGRGSSPRWQRFAELAKLLEQRAPQCRTIVTGTAPEAELCRAVAAASPAAIDLCGQLSLEQLIALLERASVVVANSTGVLHIAAALETPVVGIYPSEPPALSPRRWGPRSARSRVLTARQLDSIDPESVARCVLELVAPAELQQQR